MTSVPKLYCTDADLAVWASGDFSLLCPPSQLIASAADGVFAAGSPWVLTSASVDFGARGLLPGMVVNLTAPKTSFPGVGTLAAVATVSGSSVTLARLTLGGLGQPFAPDAGLASVAFSCLTLNTQIEEASYQINHRFGLNETRGIRQADLFDVRELRQATAFLVLAEQYLDRAHASDGNTDAFQAKSKLYRDKFEDITGRMTLHLNQSLTSPGETSPKFGRLVR